MNCRGLILALTTAGRLLAKHGAQTKKHDTLKTGAKVITTQAWHTEWVIVACRHNTWASRSSGWMINCTRGFRVAHIFHIFVAPNLAAFFMLTLWSSELKLGGWPAINWHLAPFPLTNSSGVRPLLESCRASTFTTSCLDCENHRSQTQAHEKISNTHENVARWYYIAHELLIL